MPFNIKTKGTGAIADIAIDEMLVKVSKQTEPKGELSWCLPCRLIYNSKFFNSEELTEIYTKSYFQLEERIHDLDVFVYNDEIFLNWYSKHIYQMVKNIEKEYNRTINDIYDIGGRDGFVLKDLAEERYQCTVLDPIPRASCSPKVKKRDVWSSEVVSKDGVDLVLFCDVLAHCVDIQKEIGNLRNIVKDDGLVYLEVPYDIGTVFFWLLFLKWRGKNLPIDVTHFTYFSRRSIIRLLEGNGLKCLKFSYEKLPGHKGVTHMSVLAKIKENVPQGRYKGISLFFGLFESRIILKWIKQIFAAFG